MAQTAFRLMGFVIVIPLQQQNIDDFSQKGSRCFAIEPAGVAFGYGYL
jgi:hypothetical protein